MKRYSTIVFASIIAVISIFSIVLLYQTLATFKKFFIDFQIQELSRFTKVIEKNLTPLDTSEIKNLKKILFQIDSLIDVRFTIIDSNGLVLIETRENEAKLDNHLYRTEIQLALKKGEGFSTRYSKTMKADYIYFAKKMNLNNGGYVFLRTSVPMKNLNTFFANVQEKVIFTFLALFGSVMLISLFLSKRLTKPILELVDASKKVAEGDFSIQLDERGDSEISFLKHNFNEMVAEIRKNLQQVIQQRNFMNNLINALEQAVAIITKNKDIIFCNRYYKSLVLKNGESFDNIENENILNQLNEIINGRKDSTIEVQIGDKIFLSSVRTLEDTTQILHILYDISMIKKIENIKRDLVANVSHELRTPLTAIKGYIETLEEEIPCEQFKYIETIKKNTERIIYIVDDLLNLVSLEDANARLFVTEVNLCELVQQVVPTFKHKLEEKNLKIEVICDDDFPNINADAFRLEQVFINLIDNAIKYSEKGTIRIELRKVDDETVKIIISDEGIGIPKEHQERIFERFYTVDKSRSRKYGGTGLGLSIVKHIILLHDGNIQVESEEGKGTKFIIHLPVN
ncbi:HAMP domain-containing histidine kinase [Bacteroidetes/Chlorobi group bacterium Naka2016]|jgi:two-component system phosphate regulon sensor histidine kinase PhoR|nr:MAG: HAMP domain-containing histidine kinase [Bacteroidetes/Chlorobi group bacterium Naka2016]